MRSSHTVDRVDTAFDDDRLVADAGLLVPATLALHLGLKGLVDRFLDLGRAAGRANVGDKLLTLIMSALAGGDSIDDADALSAGSRSRSLRTTSPAGRRGSVWGPGSSPPRPSAGGCSGSSGGSPAQPGGSRCTCRVAGPGRSAGRQPWRGSGPCRSSPDLSAITSRRSGAGGSVGGNRPPSVGDAVGACFGRPSTVLRPGHAPPTARSGPRARHRPIRRRGSVDPGLVRRPNELENPLRPRFQVLAATTHPIRIDGWQWGCHQLAQPTNLGPAGDCGTVFTFSRRGTTPLGVCSSGPTCIRWRTGSGRSPPRDALPCRPREQSGQRRTRPRTQPPANACADPRRSSSDRRGHIGPGR